VPTETVLRVHLFLRSALVIEREAPLSWIAIIVDRLLGFGTLVRHKFVRV
jgi:hypothetical protein